MGRIASTFDMSRIRGEAALIPYLMADYPSREAVRETLCALEDSGADMVELGIPFSDPLADGTTLQRINQLALERGASLRSALELVTSIRATLSIPLILMSYYNPILSLGHQPFAAAAIDAGVDGVIVPDLPVEESGELRDACLEVGLDLVGMVAPTTTAERMRQISEQSSGFIYCVSLKGVTGARSELSTGVKELVGRVRETTKLPIVVGFGISSEAQVRSVATFADGVVVASALLDRIEREQRPAPEVAGKFVARLKAACRDARAPA